MLSFLHYTFERTLQMKPTPQKPGETPNKPGPHIAVNPQTGKPTNPPQKETSKPGAVHLPPTDKPNQGWVPDPKKK